MWALKRKLSIVLISVLVFLVFGFLVYKSFFVEIPTCSDVKQNGSETGIDCGGSCTQVCRVQAVSVNVIWSKSFEVSNGVSNIAALIENPNFDFNMSAVYKIKIFDEDGVRIKDFSKKISLTPGEKRLIFIPLIITGKKKIKQTFIDFDKIESLTIGSNNKSEVVVTSKTIIEEGTQTRLTVGIKNTGLKPVRDIEVSAVLKNNDGNVIDAGKSFIDYINKRGDGKVQITWPKHFDNENILIDVYLRRVGI